MKNEHALVKTSLNNSPRGFSQETQTAACHLCQTKQSFICISLCYKNIYGHDQDNKNLNFYKFEHLTGNNNNNCLSLDFMIKVGSRFIIINYQILNYIYLAVSIFSDTFESSNILVIGSTSA